MTTRQAAKLTALRAEADMHGDAATVQLIDSALAGDAESAAKLGIAAKATRAARTGIASTAAPRARRAPGIGAPSHPWSHDEEE